MSDLCDTNVSRRAILGAAGALFAWNFIPKFAYARAGARDSRFLCIVLRGALDGLSAVAPIGDPDYVALRESIALAKDGPTAALPLTGSLPCTPRCRIWPASTEPGKRPLSMRPQQATAIAPISTDRMFWKAASRVPAGLSPAG